LEKSTLQCTLFLSSLSRHILAKIAIQFIALSLLVWYSKHAVDSFQQEGGVHVIDMLTLIITVTAGILVHIICKWLNGDS